MNSNMTNTIDFLFRRIEHSKSMIEKERILDLFFDESKKIRGSNNLDEIKHLRKLTQVIIDKYCD